MNGGGSLRRLPPLSGESGSSAAGVGAPTYTIRRRSSFKNMAGIPPFSSRSAAPAAPGFSSSDEGLYDDEPQRHFLDACFLCRKHLGDGCDIFMYRGDTPFCSEECRQEQIEIDEVKAKRVSMKQHQEQQKQRSSPPKSPRIQVRAPAGTIVAG